MIILNIFLLNGGNLWDTKKIKFANLREWLDVGKIKKNIIKERSF
jgi:hypothetical protein